MCNRIHVCSPCSITCEIDTWPKNSVISIPSPLQKRPFILLNPVKTTSVVHWLFVTGHPTLLQRQNTSWHRSVLQRVGSYWWTQSSLCSPHSPNKDTEISKTHLILKAVNRQSSRAISHRSMCKCSNHHCSRSLWHQRAGTDSLSWGEGGGYAGAARR